MTQRRARLVIVGAGIMGAALARSVRNKRPDVHITMIDTGPTIGTAPGQHLHETQDQELWQKYVRRVAAGRQDLYVGAASMPEISSVAGAPGGVYRLKAFGEDADELPASAVGWNSGGMGVHWTAATPTPYGSEVFDFVGSEEWRADLAQAQDLLQVHPAPYGKEDACEVVTSVLRSVFDDVSAPGRRVQTMPMAVQPLPPDEVPLSGPLRRTGPNVIFPAISAGTDPNFTLVSDTLCLRLIMTNGRAAGVVVRNVLTGNEEEIGGDIVAVCADTLRTPQILWASGLRLPALGRYLNVHAFLTGRVIVDLDRVPIDLPTVQLPQRGESCVGMLWLPHSDGAQPFQGQLTNSLILESDLRTRVEYAVSLGWYVPTETRADNRVEFSDAEFDAAGMPRMRIHFAHSDRDRAMIAAGQQSQQRAGEALGKFVPGRDSALLPPGSSLHHTGTVRMGAYNDGSSVCDPTGRVWDTTNVFVAGNGVIPTAMIANTTLTGVITAVRAARGICQRLEDTH